MKKNLQTMLFLLCATAVTYGQDIIYTVSGELNNQKVSLDSIMVENLSNNTWMTFKDLPDEQYYQINLTKKTFWGTVGINDFNSGVGFIEVQNLPGFLVLSFRKNSPERINLSIYNIAGQKIYSESNKLINPGNLIRVQPGATGVYLVTIETPQVTQSFKVIGQTVNSVNKVEILDGNPVITNTKSASFSIENNFSFNIGDSIRMSVFKTNNYAASKAHLIFVSRNFEFQFKALEDSNILVTTGVIDKSGFPNLSIGKLTVQSMLDSTSVNLNGTFQITNEVDQDDEFPIIFKIGDQLLFGYYPSRINHDKITLNDMLIFYLNFYPEITSLKFTNDELSNKLIADSNYNELIQNLKTNLDFGYSPLNDSIFLKLVNATKNSMITKTEKSLKMDEIPQPQPRTSEYNFTYKSNEMSWENFSFHCGISLEIKDKTGAIVFGPNIIPATELLYSIESMAQYVLNKNIFKVENSKVQFSLLKDGEYDIAFSNGYAAGNVSKVTYDKANSYNKNMLAWTLALMVIPETILKKFKSANACYESMSDIIFTYAEMMKNGILNETMSPGEFSVFAVKFGDAIMANINNCDDLIPTGKEYFKLLKEILKKLNIYNIVANVTNLTAMANDFYGLDISGTEKKYYYNYLLFSDLEYKNISSKEFTGYEGDELHYEAEIKEKKTKYIQTHGDQIYSPTFKKKEEFGDANELPFKATLIKGDAKVIDTNPKVQLGSLNSEFEMGKDSSIVVITPDFPYKEIVPDTIILKPTPLYIGTWEAIEQNGFPIGTKIMGVGRLYCKIAPIYISEGALTSFICKFDSEKVTLTAIWADLLKKEYTLGRTEDSICYPKFTGKTYLEKNFSQVFSYSYKFDSQEGIQLLNPLTNEYATSIIEFIINENQGNEMIIDFRNTGAPEFGMLKLIRKE